VAIIVATVVIDQFTKFLAVAYLTGKPSVEVFGRFFMFTLVYNEGGALGTSFGSTTYYLVSSVIILVIVLYYLYLNRNTALVAYPLAFIAGGAIGNIIDRIRLGRVVDFLDVDFFDINVFGYRLERWWTFNLADVAISCSSLFLLVDIFIAHHRENKQASQEESNHQTR